jgi:D-alanyl-D-alanine dipeptidase
VKRISITEPVTDLRHIKIEDNGEPLVDFREHCPKLLLDRPRFRYRREHLVRLGVAQRLREATENLPEPFRISIIEGWRAPLIQKRMYLAVWNTSIERHPEWTDAVRRRFVNRWTAPIHGKVPPPHTTGAAIDVVLTDPEGEPMDLSSPFEPTDIRCFVTDSPGLSNTALLHRQILKKALEDAGLTNYPSEYWHYSYGDQGWAYRGGHPYALYNQIVPDDWVPDPKDDTEEPLTFLIEPPKL